MSDVMMRGGGLGVALAGVEGVCLGRADVEDGRTAFSVAFAEDTWFADIGVGNSRTGADETRLCPLAKRTLVADPDLARQLDKRVTDHTPRLALVAHLAHRNPSQLVARNQIRIYKSGVSVG